MWNGMTPQEIVAYTTWNTAHPSRRELWARGSLPTTSIHLLFKEDPVSLESPYDMQKLNGYKFKCQYVKTKKNDDIRRTGSKYTLITLDVERSIHTKEQGSKRGTIRTH